MLKLNEVAYAKKLIEEHNGLVTLSDLILLGKYYEYKNLDIKDNLKQYINNCVSEYNEVIYDKYIELVIQHTKTNKIRDNIFVPITQKEKDALLGLKGNICQRVAFCLLMVSKYYLLNPSQKDCDMETRIQKSVYFNGSWRDIFKLAKTTYNRNQRDKIIVELCAAGFLELTEFHHFIILKADIGGAEVVKLACNDDMVYYMFKWRGDNVIICERCGLPVKVSSVKTHKQKYCSSCRKIVEREQTRLRVINFRNRQKEEV